MFDRDFWIQLVVVAAVGLFLLVMLWPIRSTGVKLLKKWQVADPTDAQVEDAVRYLKRRRLLYPWLYSVLWLVPKWGDDVDQLVVVVLAGTLLAELLALRPRRGARREASLAPRGLFDIASRWVLLTYVVFVVVVAVYLVISPRWTAVAWLAGSVLAVALAVWAAVARPADGDEAVDMALRTRSVHVATGLGVAVVGGLAGPWFGIAGLLAWVSMANTKPQPAKIVR
ncbi:hypothetical protein SK803_06390 [Lentzea sp. BCCO 10_0856]|uniref:Uncharacterized protein n=1 Tax=Lentzea miocenica TaxID=3095431 RepID=A0ABU4SVM5_9PSEU|nr:hypothetical protein [Lentzea sp. BCCO 10_0856]MDX8029832.1 hypothetical protein [Lentzea sp. BCCO 10_0856]